MSKRRRPGFRLNLPQPLLDLIKSCETNCVAGCCELDAYNLHPDPMVPWFRFRLGTGEVWRVFDQLAELVRAVGGHPGEVRSDDHEFNHIWQTGPECAGYLRQWQAAAAEAFGRARDKPFPVIRPVWRTTDMRQLAEGIDRDAAFDRLPILADALEDAGCDDPDVLAHCRRSGPHAGGCWVTDLIRGE